MKLLRKLFKFLEENRNVLADAMLANELTPEENYYRRIR